MAKKLRLKEGDVFSIPLSNEKAGFGQIICFPRSRDSFIMCVFDSIGNIDEPFNLEIICKSPIIFLGYSLDAKLYHGDWQILGNYTENIQDIVLPYYRLGTPPEDIYIVNYKGVRLKRIDVETFNKLYYETTIAPVRYENALKAYLRMQEWKADDYNKLLYENVLKSRKIFENLHL